MIRRRRPVEVVIVRNGIRGPLHLAIPVAEQRWAAACGRTVGGGRVFVWSDRTGGDVWGEVRTCPECERLGDRAESTTDLATLAGWSTPPTGAASPTGRRASLVRR